MASEARSKRWIWLVLVVLIVVVLCATFPPARRLSARFFNSLREQKVQAVNVDLTNLTDPNANPALHQMITQMISDKVKVNVSEKPQPAADAAAAGQLAGFRVELLSARKDAPKLIVTGERAFDLTIDRARLAEILKEAGRSDLQLPDSIDGAVVAAKFPRSVVARYGSCPGRPSAAANVATPPPATMKFDDCAILHEGPSPEVQVPQGFDFEKLAEIALEVAGMTPPQAQQFLQTVNWKQTLGVSVPRFMRSYESVKVNGVQGTLLNMAGRRGPTYTLLWAKNGMVYSLTGYGDSSDAVSLADSLK